MGKGGSIEDERPAQILKDLGLNLDRDEVMQFLELVYRIGIYRIDNPGATAGAGVCLREQAQTRRRFFKEYDAYLKRGLGRLFNAGETRLRQLGIYPKKFTICGFAWAFSEFL